MNLTEEGNSYFKASGVQNVSVFFFSFLIDRALIIEGNISPGNTG